MVGVTTLKVDFKGFLIFLILWLSDWSNFFFYSNRFMFNGQLKGALDEFHNEMESVTTFMRVKTAKYEEKFKLALKVKIS